MGDTASPSVSTRRLRHESITVFDRFNGRYFLKGQIMESQQRHIRHDILGCLNSISLSVQVLKMSDEPDEIASFLKVIDEQIAKAEQLVRKWGTTDAGDPPPFAEMGATRIGWNNFQDGHAH
jgi:hypothetical protein